MFSFHRSSLKCQRVGEKLPHHTGKEPQAPSVHQQQEYLSAEHTAPALKDVGSGLRCAHGKGDRCGKYRHAEQYIALRRFKQQLDIIPSQNQYEDQCDQCYGAACAYAEYRQENGIEAGKVKRRQFGIEYPLIGRSSDFQYKKQEREKEIAALDSTLAEKQDELETVQNRIDNFDQGAHSIERLEQRIESDAEFQLPDPPTLMTAKTYKQRVVDPLIKKLKEVIREVFYHYYKALDSYHRLNTTNGRLYRENERLTAANDRLKGENDALRSELKDFRFLRKVLGSQQIDSLITQAKDMEQQRKQTQRTRRRNTNFER